MKYNFQNEALRKLYEKRTGKYAELPDEVIKHFFKLISAIKAATDERDLRALKARHFEKLKGDRSGQYSMKLGKQFRLIFSIEQTDGCTELQLRGIEDYH